jgi:hypothetical protein
VHLFEEGHLQRLGQSLHFLVEGRRRLEAGVGVVGPHEVIVAADLVHECTRGLGRVEVCEDRIQLGLRMTSDKAVRMDQEKAVRMDQEKAVRMDQEKAVRMDQEKAVRMDQEKAVRMDQEKAVRMDQEKAVRMDQEKAVRMDQEKAVRMGQEKAVRTIAIFLIYNIRAS